MWQRDEDSCQDVQVVAGGFGSDPEPDPFLSQPLLERVARQSALQPGGGDRLSALAFHCGDCEVAFRDDRLVYMPAQTFEEDMPDRDARRTVHAGAGEGVY